MNGKLSKTTKIILGIFTATFFLSVAGLLYVLFFLRNPVISEVNLSQREKELCKTPLGPSEILSVKKCIKEDLVIYEKYTNNLSFTDSGMVTYYNDNGDILCKYGLFMGGCDDFEEEVKDCDWELICTNNPAK